MRHISNSAHLNQPFSMDEDSQAMRAPERPRPSTLRGGVTRAVGFLIFTLRMCFACARRYCVHLIAGGASHGRRAFEVLPLHCVLEWICLVVCFVLFCFLFVCFLCAFSHDVCKTQTTHSFHCSRSHWTPTLVTPLCRAAAAAARTPLWMI